MKLMYTVIKTEVCIKYVISYNEEYISDVYDIYMDGRIVTSDEFI